MQDRPELEQLLLAVARFVETDVRPKLKADPGLSFRALIAANLCKIGALELMAEDDQDTKELRGLSKLLTDVDPAPPSSRYERRKTIRAANLRLSREIREGKLTSDREAAIFDHLMKTLTDKLSVSNPRFDTSTGEQS